MTKEVKSKHVRLLESMYKGRAYTYAQISSQFKAGNPRDLIYKIRMMGVTVKTKLSSKGTTSFYL